MTNYSITLTLMSILLGYVAILLIYNLYYQFQSSHAKNKKTVNEPLSVNTPVNKINAPLNILTSNSDQLSDLQYDLQNAIANDELQLHYQIKVDSMTRAPVGAEALLRWHHPIKGVLNPVDFMHIADRYDLSYSVNQWILEECCSILRQLSDEHIPFNMSINMSPQQISNTDFFYEVTRQLKRFNLACSSLSFDLNEIDTAKNPLLNNQLKRFKEAGINIAMNNFGHHSTNTSQIKDWQVNALKLAPNFTFDVANSNEKRNIVQSIIELAHTLKLNVVAEGVETESQRRALEELGCDQMQGSIITRPLPEERFIHLLKNLKPLFEHSLTQIPQYS